MVAPICVALIIVGSILISYSVFPYKNGEVEKATEVTLPETVCLEYCILPTCI